MKERMGSARRGIVGSVGLVLAIWACGGSSSQSLGLADGGGGGPFGVGDDASTGSSSSSGGMTSSGGSSGASSGAPTGVSSTCIVGSRGCLCDTTGACSAGLTCTPQSATNPSLCCSGSDCTPSGGPIGATCGMVTAASMCTPGITILPANGTNDGCGYPASDFNESTTLCGINAVGGGSKPAVIQVFYSDEHALTLGCATSTDPVSALPANPGAVSYPQTGDPACVDNVSRPLRPVLYVTDITADPTCTTGDLQHGGHPYDPIAVFGTWKSATEGAGNMGTPLQADPMPANAWNLGSSADAVPAAAMTCNQGGFGGRGGGGGNSFGAELRFEVGLISGHSYRFQSVVHDGDQTRGGDSGEACAVFCAGTGSSCPGMATCAAGNSAMCPTGTYCGEDGCCWPPGQGPMPDASSVVIR